jgi:hypothetical protein
VRRGRAHNKRRKQQGLPPEPVVEPLLWILAATFSAPMLQKLKVEIAPGWPAGVYFHGDDVYRVGIIVANELPRDRSTLLVRIMAAGPALAGAIAELMELPPDAVERTVAEQILVHLQQALGKKPSRTPEEEEFIVKMLKTWESARAEGRADALLTVLRARGIVVSGAARKRILAEEDLARLNRWIERAISAASIAEVFDEPSRAA